MFYLLTVLFLIYYIYRLLKPYDLKGLVDLTNKVKENGEDKELVNKLTGVIAFGVLMLIQQITEFIYLLVAIKIDPYKIPSILMVLWFVVVIAKSRKSKTDINNIDYKKIKIKGIIYHLIDITYFSYMLYSILS